MPLKRHDIIFFVSDEIRFFMLQGKIMFGSLNKASCKAEMFSIHHGHTQQKVLPSRQYGCWELNERKYISKGKVYVHYLIKVCFSLHLLKISLLAVLHGSLMLQIYQIKYRLFCPLSMQRIWLFYSKTIMENL